MKANTTAIALEALGQVAGIILTPTSSGIIVRRKYPPVKPTSQQAAARAAFTAADDAWATLDEPQKVLWREWKPWYRMWGYSLFMKVNIPRCRAGLPPLIVPPDYPPWA
jgi:hypothetical protein